MPPSGKTIEVVGGGIKKCPRCGGSHGFRLPAAWAPGGRTYVPCPEVTRFYRLTDFWIDSTPNVLDEESILSTVRELHGARDLEEKLRRWREVRRAGFWLIYEYREIAEEVIQAYIQGLSYPALTGACCLAERMMNRLVFGLRDYHKRSAHYKKIHRKDRLQKWGQLRKILRDWKVIDSQQATQLKRLQRLRTDAVHYVRDYDYGPAAAEALELVTKLIDSLFFVFDRKDIFRIFEVPGEVWVRADKEDDPFVREFVLPLCRRLGSTVLFLGEGGYKEDGAVVGPMTETEFIEHRKAYLKDSPKHDDGKTPREFTIEVQGSKCVFIVP